MVLHPKTPQHIIDVVSRIPESMSSYGWNMDASKCNFTPKYKVGDSVYCLIIDNLLNKHIDKSTQINYFIGEITGYYKEGYGVIIKKIIYQQNKLHGYYKVGGHHTIYHKWFDRANDKDLLKQLNRLRNKNKVFIFR